MRWVVVVVGAVLGATGAVMLLARFAAGDTLFFTNPLLVGGLLVGLAATSWSVARGLGGLPMVTLALSIGAILLGAGVAAHTHTALAVAFTSALRMPLLAGLGLVSLGAARRDGIPVPRWIDRTIAAVATGGFLALLLIAPVETPFGDFDPVVTTPEALLTITAIVGISLVQLTTATLIVVPAGLWWVALRSAPAARTHRVALAAISSAPIALYAISILLATWRGDTESLSAAAWLMGGLSAAILAVGLPVLVPPASVPSEPRPEVRLDSLTARENEILALLADGHTNQAIADQLVISKRTVDAHVRSLFAKLGVSGEGNPRVRATTLWRQIGK